MVWRLTRWAFVMTKKTYPLIHKGWFSAPWKYGPLPGVVRLRELAGSSHLQFGTKKEKVELRRSGLQLRETVGSVLPFFWSVEPGKGEACRQSIYRETGVEELAMLR